jgi:phosphomannomutase / phosphoglucomutase
MPRLGLAFDGDGDRLGVVTKDGEIIYPDRQLMLFARDVLAACPGRADHLRRQVHAQPGRWIRAHGGQPLMWKTGHSLIKAKLKETGAPLAGEMSGHIFFKDRWYGFDDGLYAGARLLEICSRANGSVGGAQRAARCGQHARAAVEDSPKARTSRWWSVSAGGEVHGARGDHDRRRAGRVRGRLRPRARLEHDAGVVLRFEADNDAALARIQADFKRALLP